jgi:hypothetical protein
VKQQKDNANEAAGEFDDEPDDATEDSGVCNRVVCVTEMQIEASTAVHTHASAPSRKRRQAGTQVALTT